MDGIGKSLGRLKATLDQKASVWTTVWRGPQPAASSAPPGAIATEPLLWLRHERGVDERLALRLNVSASPPRSRPRFRVSRARVPQEGDSGTIGLTLRVPAIAGCRCGSSTRAAASGRATGARCHT